MPNLRTTTEVYKKSYALIEGDLFEIGGLWYEVVTSKPSTGTRERLNLTLIPEGGSLEYEHISIFCTGTEQFKVRTANPKL